MRREAYDHHGSTRQGRALPKRTSAKGKSLDARLAKALRELGEPVCESIVRWQAERWRRDPGQLAWSTEQVWSPRSVAFACRNMTGQRGLDPLKLGADAPSNARDDHDYYSGTRETGT